MAFREYDTVRVARLDQLSREVSGTDAVLRQPRVGDEGAVLEIDEDRYLVESVDPDGRTIWLAEFTEGELAWVSSVISPA